LRGKSRSSACSIAPSHLRTVIDDLIVDEDNAVILWTMPGTHRGALRGIQPNGQPVRFTGMDILRIENGKITTRWDEENNRASPPLRLRPGAFHSKPFPCRQQTPISQAPSVEDQTFNWPLGATPAAFGSICAIYVSQQHGRCTPDSCRDFAMR
jgi:SnoaL-like polyketide cyclase